MQRNSVLIAPSVLSCDFSNLANEIIAMEQAGADIFHLDIMDGHYVPNLTFGFVITETISKLTKLPMDAHLMVANPQDYIDNMAKLGVSYLSFHPETVFHPHRVIQSIKDSGMKAGIALNPGIPLAIIDELLPDLDYVLLMSVNPGYSGQSYISHITEKVRTLKAMITKKSLSTLIEVDGGINNIIAYDLVAAGADILVSASYLFAHQDYAQAIRSLRNVQ